MTIRNIPLNQLVPSKANVRKTAPLDRIEELAANIKALGLLQNLQVRATESGKFEVVAGKRRLAALKMLAKEKAIPKSADIPCQVVEGDNAAEVSLAENVMRLPMHPADQLIAFKALAEEGKGVEDIAGRFGCAPSTVKQRMRLASVSPALFELYRSDGMTLDQLMAFTVSDDHGAQEAVWNDLPEWNRRPETIRRNLTQAHVEAGDAKVQFVGIETYIAAGGGVLRDLFTPEHQGYLTDPALLDRLATERLEREAGAIRAEGWKWVDILPDADRDTLRGYGRAFPEREPLNEEQQAELSRLEQKYDELSAEEGDDPFGNITAEMVLLSEQIDRLSEGNVRWLPEDVARAGAIVTIGYEGTLEVARGLIRPEDMSEEEQRPATRKAVSGGKAVKRESGALPAPLVEDLTAHRTAALRAMLLGNADVALVAVVHAMALPLFYGPTVRQTCLELRIANARLRGTQDSPAAHKLDGRYEEFGQHLPEAAGDLWDWLLARDMAGHLDLLAFCAACSVNAVVKPHESSDERVAHADKLAVALNLDMTQWWQPTGESYLSRVSKARILEAVTEGVSKSAADNFLKLKKDELVTHAEQRLAGTGWLPAILRPPVVASAEPEAETLAA